MRTIATLILTIVLLSCQTSNSNDNSTAKNDRAKQNLRGNVKSFKEYTFKTEEDVNKIGPKETNCVLYRIFNKDGNVTDLFQYGENGKLTVKNIFLYNDHGLLIEKNASIYFWGNDLEKITYEYDSNAKLVRQKEYRGRDVLNLWSTITFSYNSNGQLVEEIEKGSETDRKKYEYDNKGNCTETKLYFSNDLGRIYKTKYDEKNNPVEESTVYPLDNKSDKTINKYDENNNVISKSFKDSESSYEEIYKYEYDSNGNWIKKTKIKNGSLQLITVREFEYYE